MKKYLPIFVIILTLAILPSALLAQDPNTFLDSAATAAGYNIEAGGETGIATLLGGITRVFLSFLGVIFIIYTIYGGFMWMTAGGNEDKVGKAKKIITNGVIGLIIVISAGSIYWLVSNTILSVDAGGATTGGAAS